LSQLKVRQFDFVCLEITVHIVFSMHTVPGSVVIGVLCCVAVNIGLQNTTGCSVTTRLLSGVL
jgi:hypothetical protein